MKPKTVTTVVMLASFLIGAIAFVAALLLNSVVAHGVLMLSLFVFAVFAAAKISNSGWWQRACRWVRESDLD